MNLSGSCIFLTLVITCTSQTDNCGPGEEYEKEGCEPKCQEVLEEPCLRAEKVPGCYCKYGTIRDKTRNCITIKECSDQICTEPNQYLQMAAVPMACSGEGTANPILLFRPQPMCVCEKGYATANGGSQRDCVEISNCQRPN